MKKLMASWMTALLIGGSAGAGADSFLSAPEKLKPDERFGGDLVYIVDNVLERLPNFDSLMVDEPVIFLADDSDYKGFKASDLAAISNMVRESFTRGLSSQPVSFGNFQVVEEPGPSVLYVRLGLKDLYVKKEKRGLFSYTPVGMVAHGVSGLTSDAIDKTNLVELQLEAEMLESETGDIIFAAVLDRGHRRDKHAGQKEQQAGWDVPGAVAEKLGRRLACRLDNARLPEAKRTDCVKTIPIEG